MITDQKFSNLIQSVTITNESFAELQSEGFKSDFLTDEQKKCFSWVYRQFVKHGQVPTIERVREQFSWVRPTERTPSAIPALMEDIKSTYLVNVYNSMFQDVGREIVQARSAPDISTSMRLIAEAEDKIRATLMSSTELFAAPDVVDITKDGYTDEYMADYVNRRDNGTYYGVPFPWKLLSEQTGGMRKGDLNVIVARTGVGKTHAMVICAVTQFLEGYNVTAFSGEMTTSDMMDRVVCHIAKVPYGALRKGKLDKDQEVRLERALKNMEGRKNFLRVYGANSEMGGATVENIVGFAINDKPDILMIDGAYLLHDPNKDKYVRAGNIVRNLKRAALSLNIPILITWQNNRKGKEEEAGTDTLALTDDLAQDSSIVLRLYQTPDMMFTNRMLLQLVKSRRSRLISYEVRWALDEPDLITQLSEPEELVKEDEFDNRPTQPNEQETDTLFDAEVVFGSGDFPSFTDEPIETSTVPQAA